MVGRARPRVCLLPALACATALATGPAMSDGGLFRQLDAEGGALDALKWRARPVLVFADDPANAAYRAQLALLRKARAGLEERDITVFGDAEPGSSEALRARLKVEGFTLVLIGKDGGVKLRADSPVAPEDLFRTIDRMPMRQREMSGE